jgi:hypothetical protein
MYFAGLDLGQRRDYSALAVVEKIEQRRAFGGAGLALMAVRYAERMPLGTPYPKVVERVREIVRSDELRGDCALAVDATGVGAPVIDMLRAARLGCEIAPVTITGGERSSGYETVAKRDLMAELLVLLENRRLKIGKLREGLRLRRELGDVRMRANRGGGWRVGADGSGGTRRSGDCAGAGVLARERVEICGRTIAKTYLQLTGWGNGWRRRSGRTICLRRSGLRGRSGIAGWRIMIWCCGLIADWRRKGESRCSFR